MRLRMGLLVIAAALVALLPAVSVGGTISAYLEGLPEGDPNTIDTWVGTAGEGWVDGWKTKTYDGASNTFTLANANPLLDIPDTNNYVYVEMDGSKQGSLVTIGRQYDTTISIDPAQDYTISTLFRVDENLGEGTTFYTPGAGYDRYQLYQSNSSSIGRGGNSYSTWIIGAYGVAYATSDSDPTLVPAGNWTFDDYTTGSRYGWDTGISMTQDHTLSVAVTVHPDYTWDATLDDLDDAAPAYTRTNMRFRNQAYTAGLVEYFAKGSHDDDVRQFSVDNLVVSQVPEPSVLVMGLGAALAGLALGRRRK